MITIAGRKVTHWRDYLDPVAVFDAIGWPSLRNPDPSVGQWVTGLTSVMTEPATLVTDPAQLCDVVRVPLIEQQARTPILARP